MKPNKKTGRLSITRGDKYHTGIGHSGAIKLDKDQVDALAKTISTTSEDFCKDMKKINTDIPQKLDEMKEDVQNYLASIMYYNFPHLTYADLVAEMAKYPVSAMYSEGDISSANLAIDKLGEKLADTSSGLKKVASGMKELDQAQAAEMYNQAMYGIPATRNW